MARAKVGSRNFIVTVDACLCPVKVNEEWLTFRQS